MSEPALPEGFPKVHDTVVHMLADAARQSPDAIALVEGDRALIYRQYLRCVAGLARELEGLGARGGRVAILCGNSIEMAVASFAIHAAGAQAVPVNPVYTGRELAHILADAEPLAVIHDEGAVAVVKPILHDLGIVHAIPVGGEAGRRFDAWRDDEDATLPAMPGSDDPATLQYTGGTTGLPKGVNTTHGQMAINIAQREAVLPTVPGGEAILCVMPLFIGLMEHPRFAGTDFSSLRTAYSGSAPLPGETLKSWQGATGCPILEGFGQSEAGPVLTYIGEGMEIVPGSVGAPLPLTEIVDTETGSRALGIGETGEIRARGPQIMSGYRNRLDETAKTLRGGRLHTGDIGEFDERGYLYIRDRKKDMVISGGCNIYPREVDEVLHAAHPDVVEAASFGSPDSYRGEILVAHVVLREGSAAAEADILSHCADNLAKYKLPVRIEFVDAVARTAVGKVDRKTLRQQAG